MVSKCSRNRSRTIRHRRLRTKVFGTPDRPRMAVYKSLNNIYVQFIDDLAGHTIASVSTLEKPVNAELESRTNIEAATRVGKAAAEKAKAKGITNVIFDRGGHKYHGRIKALADSAREAGLQF